MMAAVELHGATLRYGAGEAGQMVFEDVDLTVEAGAFVSIIGRSGAGKSTLLAVIAGLLSPTAGSVLIDGLAQDGPNPEKVGVVFQDPGLFPWLTAAENVAFPLELRKVAKRERLARATELLELVGLEQATSKLPKQLSGGMRQRVAIARGLALEPDILLMDEPFGALDEQTREHMGAELLRLWERTRKTIIFVTHSINEAVYLADDVYVLCPGGGPPIEKVAIPLARPRLIEAMGFLEFGQTRNHVRALLEGRRPDDSMDQPFEGPTARQSDGIRASETARTLPDAGVR